MKVECAMQNERIDGLVINHSPAFLPKQKRMQALNVKEMDVSWWMSIKYA
jgi:hypothetical protein